ncbi:MAG: hypothetical protein AB1640_16965 [bacterium]
MPVLRPGAAGLLGGALGSAAGVLLIALAHAFEPSLQLLIGSWHLLAFLTAATTGIGILAALPVSLIAARKDPVCSLQQENG